MKRRDLLKKLKAAGFREVRDDGDHIENLMNLQQKLS